MKSMRMAMLALVAAIGAATLSGPANAAALTDMSAVCPAGRHWDAAHYNRWSVWHPGRCTRD